MGDRRCEACNGSVPDRMSRSRNDKGQLVCEECIKMTTPQWTAGLAYAQNRFGPEAAEEMRRREAAALAAIARVTAAKQASGGCEWQGCANDISFDVRHEASDGDVWLVCAEHLPDASEHLQSNSTGRVKITKRAALSVVAHDSGDNAIINHCAFCGSGAVVGSQDGTVSCEFCHTNFTVQVQPAHPFMPQTVDGQPVPPAGMPGEEPTEMSAPLDPAVNEVEEGVSSAPLDDASAPEPPEKPSGGSQPPWLKNKASSRTAGRLDESRPCRACECLGYEDSGRDGARGGGLCRCGHVSDRHPISEIRTDAKTSFLTVEGHVLDEQAYMARLALAHADDRDTVLDVVRHRHATKGQP